jgi:hypothetical protein
MFDFNAFGGRDCGYEAQVLPTTSATTAKATSRAVRIWLENKSKLEAAGFGAGASYSATYTPGLIVLRRDGDGTSTVSSCKRGDSIRPIIDLHSAKVAAAIPAGSVCTVTYSFGLITISTSKV